jgi:hypothetical protein
VSRRRGQVRRKIDRYSFPWACGATTVGFALIAAAFLLGAGLHALLLEIGVVIGLSGPIWSVSEHVRRIPEKADVVIEGVTVVIGAVLVRLALWDGAVQFKDLLLKAGAAFALAAGVVSIEDHMESKAGQESHGKPTILRSPLLLLPTVIAAAVNRGRGLRGTARDGTGHFKHDRQLICFDELPRVTTGQEEGTVSRSAERQPLESSDAPNVSRPLFGPDIGQETHTASEQVDVRGR